MNRLDDDIFSPVRFDSSIVDVSYISGGSSSDVSNCDTRFSFPNTASVITPENISVVPRKQKTDIKSPDQSEFLEANDSVFACTPVSNKNLSSLLNRKKHSSNFEKMKCDKTISLQDKNVLEKEILVKNSEPVQKSETIGIEVKNNDLKLIPKQNASNKRLTRPTTLSSNAVSVDPSEVKQVKIEKKKHNKSSKNTSSDDLKKSVSKCSINKKLMADPLGLKEDVNCLPLKDASEKCNDSKSVLDSVVEEPSSVPQDTANLETASCLPPSKYEETVEKIVHDCISMECDKIRQNLYLQQMSFYRQINKIRHEMEQQHENTTKRLCKVVEELMQMNATLKSVKNKK